MNRCKGTLPSRPTPFTKASKRTSLTDTGVRVQTRRFNVESRNDEAVEESCLRLLFFSSKPLINSEEKPARLFCPAGPPYIPGA